MGAFIIAGLVAAGTMILCLLMVLASSMMPAPSQSDLRVGPLFVGGMIIAALIAASHWLPHIGW